MATRETKRFQGAVAIHRVDQDPLIVLSMTSEEFTVLPPLRDEEDDLAAIEILLSEEVSVTPSLLAIEEDANKIERKKEGSFFQRLFKLFCKKRAPQLNEATTTPASESDCDNIDEKEASSTITPPSPSTVPKVRVGVISKPFKMQSDDCLTSDEKLDTFSTMSSLSGTGTVMKDIKSSRQYQSFCESFKNENIRDIRNTLKETISATSHGHRVFDSRVMRALSDSLEDESSRNELQEMMSREQRRKYIPKRGPHMATWKEDEENHDEEECEEQYSTVYDDEEDFTMTSFYDKENFKPQQVGKLVKQNTENAVILDDLIWTEFVASRQSTDSTSRASKRSTKHEPQRPRRHSVRHYSQSKSWWRTETINKGRDQNPHREYKRYPEKQNNGPYPRSINIKTSKRKKTAIRL